MANFEGKERRMAQIDKALAEYGFSSLEDAKALCDSKGIDVDSIVRNVQPIAFDNAVWAYTLGCAIALPSTVIERETRGLPVSRYLAINAVEVTFITTQPTSDGSFPGGTFLPVAESIIIFSAP